MFLITTLATNYVYLTLTENVTINNPYYLFVFDGLAGQEQQKVFLTDTSLYPARYNLFTIIEGTTVTFPTTGDYTYRVYEKDVNTNTTIPAEAYLLETGICRVGDTATVTTYSHDYDPDTIMYEQY